MTEQVIISDNKRLCECGCGNVVSKVGNRFIGRHNTHGNNNPNYGKKLERFKISCGCGCGQLIDNRDKYGRSRYYMCGHNRNCKGGRYKYKCNICKDRHYLIQCACGICNEVINAFDKHGRPKRFKHTHNIRDMNHPSWKGDNVGLDALHVWVRSRLPEPELCQICNIKPPHDLANITGSYTRDLGNWLYLCRKCHMIQDNQGQKVSIANTGKKLSEETRAKMKLAQRQRRPNSIVKLVKSVMNG